MALLHPRCLIRNRVPSRQFRNGLQRLELDEGAQERPSQRRPSWCPGARGRVAGQCPVEHSGTGKDLRGDVAGAGDGVRADVAPCWVFGAAILRVVVSWGSRVAGGVGVIGAEELDLYVAA